MEFLLELWQNHHDTSNAIYGVGGVIVLFIILIDYSINSSNQEENK